MRIPIQDLIHRVCRLRPDWEHQRVSSFIYLEGGYSNDNFRFEYLGERYVLRVPRRPGGDRELERRIYATDGYTNGRQRNLPEVVAFDPASGDMISRWVSGRLLADLHLDGEQLVEYLRCLHADMPPTERCYDPLAQAREHLRQAPGPGWLEALADRRWSPDELVVCHNDLNPWNVIRSPAGDWVTLDWETVGRNDPLFDLVNLHQGADLDQALLPALAERYLGRAVPASRLHACLTAFWLRETTWALAEAASGNGRPEILAQQQLGMERLQALQPNGQPAG
ncbi:MAG: phosphotransferase [Pseudomonadales bacterium]